MSSTQVTPHAKMEKPEKGKHPAYTCTDPNEPIKMTGTLELPETISKRTRCPIPKVPCRRRLTD